MDKLFHKFWYCSLIFMIGCSNEPEVDSFALYRQMKCDSLENIFEEVVENTFFTIESDLGQYEREGEPFDNEYFHVNLNCQFYYLGDAKRKVIRDSLTLIQQNQIPKELRNNETLKKSVMLLSDLFVPPLITNEYYLYDDLLNEDLEDLLVYRSKYCDEHRSRNALALDGRFSITKDGIQYIEKDGMEISHNIIIYIEKEEQQNVSISLKRIVINGMDYTLLASENENWHKVNGFTKIINGLKNTIIGNVLNNKLYLDEVKDMVDHKFSRIILGDGYLFLELSKKANLPSAEYIVRALKEKNLYEKPSVESTIVYKIQPGEIYYCVDEKNDFYFIKDGFATRGWITKIDLQLYE